MIGQNQAGTPQETSRSVFGLLDGKAASIESAKEKIEQALGIEVARLGTMRVDWNTYMRSGLLAQIHVGRWRARRALNMADLGIPDSKSSDLIQLGEKRLLPAIPAWSKFYKAKRSARTYIQLLNSYDGSARSALTRRSFRTYWGAFIPVNEFEEWRSEFENYKAQYMSVPTEIVTNWALITDALEKEYRQVANESYDRLNKLSGVTTRAMMQREEFVQEFVGRILALLPTPDEFMNSFYMEASYHYIPLPDLLEREQLEAKRLETERIAVVERGRTIRQAEEEKRKDSDLRARLARVEAEFTLAERERRLAEMDRVARQEAVAQAKSQINSFVAGMLGQVRRDMLAVAASVRESIQRNRGKLVGRKAEQLRNLIQAIERSNDFLDDPDIARMLTPIKSAVNTDKKSRDVDRLSNELELLSEELRGQLATLDMMDSNSVEVVAVSPDDLLRNVAETTGRFVVPATFDGGEREI